MSVNKTVILYFRDRLRAAGYNAILGFTSPDFAKYPKDGKVNCELWFTDGESQMYQNSEVPIEKKALIECYVFRRRNDEDLEGKFYDDADDVLKALVRNPEDRPLREKLWWDNELIPTDFASPLKRWNNSSEYAAGFVVARIDLPVNYLKTL